MNLSYFLAKRIRQGKQGDFAAVVHRIAIASIAIGLAAAIISFLVMQGFQETVKTKVFRFTGHLLITKYTLSNATEEQPFELNTESVTEATHFPFIKHIQEYSHKSGLIKTEEEVQGVVLKGVGKSFDTLRLANYLLEGRFLHLPDSGYAREILVSKQIADKLNIQLHDEVTIHFFQNPPRFRKLTVVGIYETNLSDYFDNKILIGDIRLIQRLNDWSSQTVGGVEITIDHSYFSRAEVLRFSLNSAWEQDSPWPDRLSDWIQTLMGFDFERQAEVFAGDQINERIDYDLLVETVQQKYIPIFEWLGLLSRQVTILLVIILIVVCVNMISVLLILVMERTPMVGVLKALGARNKVIRKIFIYNGMNLTLKGLMLGNMIGLGFCWIQDRFAIIRLNPRDYYMDAVPIEWSWGMVIFLNLLIFFVVSLVLLLPATLVLRIQPVKAIKFD